MAMARSAVSAFVFLLITIATTSAARVFILASGPGPRPSTIIEFQDPLTQVFPDETKAIQCIQSIMKVKDCLISLIESVSNNQFKISKICCETVVGAGDTCLSVMNPYFPPHLNSFCGKPPKPAIMLQ
ncbi:hypothetical protein LUZ61_015369 [Rhynchospora tenuis]|uniref:Prolamin-like domain-containing protein n=1 Tax=Rhynchospora tenuis TaxID=198213 RepID=A0AAD5WD24_9POAL|nr:hypothetical protein LUZ61_015369 [Rhynchospora tenuis]